MEGKLRIVGPKYDAYGKVAGESVTRESRIKITPEGVVAFGMLVLVGVACRYLNANPESCLAAVHGVSKLCGVE